ncbi:exocyst complex component EXO70A1, partial [Selaginella moellendorffii]
LAMSGGGDLNQVVARAQLVRESLIKSQSITDQMLRILGSFDQRLSALQTTMRPTQVRTHAIRNVHDNIDQTINAAETILTQFDVSRQVEPKIVEGPLDDISTYLGAVDQLKTNVDFFNFHRSFQTSDAAFKHARNLLLKAMTKLEDKFREHLTQHSKPVDPAELLRSLPSSMRLQNAFGASGETLMIEKVVHAGSGADRAKVEETLPLTLPVVIAPKAVPQLADMAQRMINASHHEQCIEVYREVRSSFLEDSLRKLGVENMTKEDVQKMQWEVLESKIGSWIQSMKVSVKLLFAAERKTCDQVFYRLEPHREECIVALLEPNFNLLASFGEAVAKSKRSPEKLFVLLDMYEAMRDLLPEIDIIFSGEATAPLRESAALLTSKLSLAAQETFDEFLEAVEKDATKTPVQDGTVHPLTSYVINYVKFLFDYQKTIRQLYKESNDLDKKESHIGQNTLKIMAALQTNLDVKAKHYKDPALLSIFLMNNIHYIVRSVKKSEAKDLLGDEWIQIHRRIVQQHASAYQRTSWVKALQCLTAQGLSSSSLGAPASSAEAGSGVSRSILKERFKTFNQLFEDMHQKQSQWSIPDAELREAVRLAVAEVLLPAYRNFLKRYGPALEGGKNPHKYIKYTPEDLEKLLAEFFEGKARKSQLFQS